MFRPDAEYWILRHVQGLQLINGFSVLRYPIQLDTVHPEYQPKPAIRKEDARGT
jgi:hypothetical protein